MCLGVVRVAVVPVVPEPFTWVTGLFASSWPPEDEDEFGRLAQVWSDAAGRLVVVAGDGALTAGDVGFSVSGASVEGFDAFWGQLLNSGWSSDAALQRVVDQSVRMAESALMVRDSVEKTKLVINIQILVLAVQLAIAALSAWLTFGAAAVVTPELVAAAGWLSWQAVARMVQEIALAAVPEFVAEAIQAAVGHTPGMWVRDADRRAMFTALTLGGLGGVLGGGVRLLSGRLVGADSAVWRGVGRAAESWWGVGLEGGLNNVATNGLLWSVAGLGWVPWVDVPADADQGQQQWLAFVNGVFTGLAFHAAGRVGQVDDAALIMVHDVGGQRRVALRGGPDGSLVAFDEAGHRVGPATVSDGVVRIRPLLGGADSAVVLAAGDVLTHVQGSTTRVSVVVDGHVVGVDGLAAGEHGVVALTTTVRAEQAMSVATDAGRVQLARGEVWTTYHAGAIGPVHDPVAGVVRPADIHSLQRGDNTLWSVGADPVNAQPLATAVRQADAVTTFYHPSYHPQTNPEAVYGSIDAAGAPLLGSGVSRVTTGGAVVFAHGLDQFLTVHPDGRLTPGIPVGSVFTAGVVDSAPPAGPAVTPTGLAGPAAGLPAPLRATPTGVGGATLTTTTTTTTTTTVAALTAVPVIAAAAFDSGQALSDVAGLLRHYRPGPAGAITPAGGAGQADTGAALVRYQTVVRDWVGAGEPADPHWVQALASAHQAVLELAHGNTNPHPLHNALRVIEEHQNLPLPPAAQQVVAGPPQPTPPTSHQPTPPATSTTNQPLVAPVVDQPIVLAAPAGGGAGVVAASAATVAGYVPPVAPHPDPQALHQARQQVTNQLSTHLAHHPDTNTNLIHTHHAPPPGLGGTDDSRGQPAGSRLSRLLNTGARPTVPDPAQVVGGGGHGGDNLSSMAASLGDLNLDPQADPLVVQVRQQVAGLMADLARWRVDQTGWTRTRSAGSSRASGCCRSPTGSPRPAAMTWSGICRRCRHRG